MDILIYAIPLILLLLVFGIGFYFGCERCFNKSHVIGTLKIAHDEADQTYLAIVIDPIHKDILTNRKDGIHLVYVEHVFNEVTK